jgi:predicted amidohydrolase
MFGRVAGSRTGRSADNPTMTIRGRGKRMPAVAAVAASFPRDIRAGLDRIERITRRARQDGAELVVFPESALGGYIYEPVVSGMSDPVGPPPALHPAGTEIHELCAIAGPTTICVGYTEAGPDGERFSSAVCVNGDGVLGRQRKVHLPPGEKGKFAAGDGFAAFDTPLGRVGMLLCYDKVFPEAARQLSLDGAGIIASLAAWPQCRLRPAAWSRNDRQTRHFNLLDQARALENQVVWVSANHTGRYGRLRFPGQAKVVDPDGRVLATTGTRRGTALARVDVSGVVTAARGEISHLEDRQPDAYFPIVEPVMSASARPGAQLELVA